jgi:hypothetical protein
VSKKYQKEDTMMIMQQELKKRIKAGGFTTVPFIKRTVVEFYAVDGFPRELLGIEDNTSYPSLEGKLIAVQSKKDRSIDAYAVDKEFVEQNYKKVDCNNSQQLIENANRMFCGVKNIPVEMVKIESLGFPATGTIEAPWGGTQDYREGAYLVPYNEDGPYVVNSDKNGPIGYMMLD